MTLPLYQALRAVGQGMVTGVAICAVVAVAVWLLGEGGLLAIVVLGGPGLILLSYVLERRAKRAQKESE